MMTPNIHTWAWRQLEFIAELWSGVVCWLTWAWHVARECGGGVTLVCTCGLAADYRHHNPGCRADLRVLHYCCCTQSAGCISTLTAVLQCCMLLTADILLLGVLPVLSSIPAATHFTYTGEGHKTKVRKVFQFYRWMTIFRHIEL